MLKFFVLFLEYNEIRNFKMCSNIFTVIYKIK
jgi:hypothetical protein